MSRVRRAAAATAGAALCAVIAFALTQGPSERVRPPAVAGSFYPASAAGLTRNVTEMLAKSPVPAEPSGRTTAVIAPHAGYVYSGQTAADAYARLKGSGARTAVVLGPSHRGFADARVWVDDADAYSIPGATIKVDREKVQALADAGIPALVGKAPGEHSIEVQLPFLQQVLEPGWTLVPVLVATEDPERCRQAAAAIAGIIDEHTVVCVSSDFTHYGSAYGYAPFTGSAEGLKAKLADLDGGAIDLIVKKDAAGFSAYCKRTGATICGAGPIMVLLGLLPSDAVGEKVSYTTSAAKTGDYSLSVSYAAIVFAVQGDKAKPEEKPMTQSRALTDSERATLLALARASLEAAVKEGRRPDMSRFTVTDALKEKRGAFVTLKIDDALRGCIGYVAPIKPLWEAVVENAANAALHDPRFNRVTSGELAGIDIEISAMSPLETITDPEKIEVGKHGIMLTRGMFRGLLLPQVATEYGWEREEFLRHTCQKAGLPENAWKDPDTRIEIFSAEVFGEKEASGK